MVESVEKTLDVGFYDVPIAAELQLDGEVLDRLLCPHARTIAVAQGQEVVLVNGFEQQSDGPLQEPVFHDRDAQGPLLAVAFGDVLAPDQPASVITPLQAVDERLDVLVQVLSILGDRHPVDAGRSVLVELAPGKTQQ